MYLTIGDDGIHHNEDDSEVINNEVVIEPYHIGSFTDYEFENIRVVYNYKVEYYQNCLVCNPYSLIIRSELRDRETVITYKESFYRFVFFANKEKNLLVVELVRKA